MQKILGRYYAEYDHETRLWSILREETRDENVEQSGGTWSVIRHPVIVKLWFPRWVSARLLKI